MGAGQVKWIQEINKLEGAEEVEDSQIIKENLMRTERTLRKLLLGTREEPIKS